MSNLSLQKKCHTLKNGSLIASAGKYLTSLISLYTLWRLCPSFDLPNRFRASCFPKFPASSTSFSTNLPYFSFGGTISREAGIPNTSCMIYIIPPANFHNPNSFNSSCTLSIATGKEAPAQSEAIFPLIPRRSHPAQSGETFDGPPSLERSGSEHRVGRLHPRFLRKRGLGRKWSPLWLKRDGVIRKTQHRGRLHPLPPEVSVPRYLRINRKVK